MARWTDLATWRGPSPNAGGRMAEVRGVVVHVADGTYEGTISWQRNAKSEVSSHFVVSHAGRIAQLVDTDITAWTQRAGNGHWLSVENEGYGGQTLTAAQIEANARIFLRAHRAYGVPLQLATKPTGRGLGHHSMGGTAWGHQMCPGVAIIAQKPAIVARAIALAKPQEDDLTPDQAKKLDAVHATVTRIYNYSDGSKRNPSLSAVEAASAVMHGKTVGGAEVFLGRRIAELETKLDEVLRLLREGSTDR